MTRKEIRLWISKWDIDAVIYLNGIFEKLDKEKLNHDEKILTEELSKEIRRRVYARNFEEIISRKFQRN